MANQKSVGVAFADPELVSGTTITGAAISGGTIAGATISGGALTGATAISATTVTVATGGTLVVDSGTATATAGAATLAKISGKITSESLTTAAGATYTLTLTNTTIAATDKVFVSVAFGTATTGQPVVANVTPATNSLVIIVRNNDAAAAFNGTIVISYFAVK